MSLDRDAALRTAENLLKQGRLAGAIEEYVRLVGDRPGDWNLANALGDLYVKAGDMERAVAQFTRAADHLYGEGFFPRASAVYKKVLKVKGNDDHAIWQLADIAGRQRLLLDARSHYTRLIRDRRAAGNERGVEDCLVRLGMLDDADVPARVVAADLLIARGEARSAARLVLGAADVQTKAGRLPEARDLLRQAAQLDPDDQEIREKLAAALAEEADGGDGPVETPAVEPVLATEAPIDGSSPPEPDPPAAEPLLLDSLFEELQARVAREHAARSEGQAGDAARAGEGEVVQERPGGEGQ